MCRLRFSLQVAAQLHHSRGQSGQRSQLLQESLAEQVEEAQVAAAEASAARVAAEAAQRAAVEALAEVQEQQATLSKEAAKIKAAGATAVQQVQRIVADARAGRLSVAEAEERLREMEREAAPPAGTAMELMGLRAATMVRLAGWEGGVGSLLRLQLRTNI